MVKAEDILHEAAELKKRKSKDYQGGQFSEADYFPYGQVSFNHMLHTKMLRIRSVSDQGGSQNFESLEDSLLDIINYAAMNVAYIRNQDVDKLANAAAELATKYPDMEIVVE